MLSGALAGFLKVAAVGLTAAAMGAGVYFLVQANGDGDRQRVQAPPSVTAPAESPEPMSPPQVVRPSPTPAAPTPTFPPADLTPPPNVDTSDWKTYESLLGFTIKYPPDWTIDPVSPRRIHFFNPLFQQGLEEAKARGETHVSRTAGMASFSVTIDNIDRFDPAANKEACESPDALTGGPAGEGEFVSLAGRAAMLCERILYGDARGDADEQSLGVAYLVEYPQGHTSLVEWTVTPPNSTDVTTRAILASLRFDTQ